MQTILLKFHKFDLNIGGLFSRLTWHVDNIWRHLLNVNNNTITTNIYYRVIQTKKIHMNNYTDKYFRKLCDINSMC